MAEWFATHIAYFTSGATFDPVVWMRVTRVVLLVVSAMLLLREPMLCGGSNRSFHRLLSGWLFVLAIYQGDTADARMQLLMESPTILSSFDLLFTEVLFTVACVALVGRLLYDYAKWREFNRQKLRYPACNQECRSA
jgi:hypothetical protein